MLQPIKEACGNKKPFQSDMVHADEKYVEGSESNELIKEAPFPQGSVSTSRPGMCERPRDIVAVLRRDTKTPGDEFVRGNVHIDFMESICAIFEHTVMGVNHHVSVHHLKG